MRLACHSQSGLCSSVSVVSSAKKGWTLGARWQSRRLEICRVMGEAMALGASSPSNPCWDAQAFSHPNATENEHFRPCSCSLSIVTTFELASKVLAFKSSNRVEQRTDHPETKRAKPNSQNDSECEMNI
jgi:hypothetical protein